MARPEDISTNPLRQRVEAIRQQYEVMHPDAAPLVTIEHLLSNVSDSLYSNEFRFVLELLQNAVDSNRLENGQPVPVDVRFELTPERLIVSNDGQPFSVEDVERLCGLVRQRKVKKIGYKGVGFKSVASITDNAQIYSPGGQFEFNKQYHPDYEYVWLVIPHWIEASQRPPEIDPERVTFVLPFHEQAKQQALYNQFSEILNPTSGALLLFLEQLGQLELRSHGHQPFKMRKRNEPESGLTLLEQDKDGKGWQPVGRWLVVSHRPTGLPPAAEADYIKRRGLSVRQERGEQLEVADTRITLAFHLDEACRFVRKKGLLYAYFPIHRQRTGFYFTLQADFLTTISRETLATPSPWNDWLIDNLPDAVVTAVQAIKQRLEQYSILYEAFPLLSSEAVKEPFRAAAQAMMIRLRDLAIILTDRPKARWIRPNRAVWLAPALRALLSNVDLARLMPDKQAFVSFTIDSHRAQTFITSSQGLAVPELGAAELVAFLQQTGWLASKSPEWIGRLLMFLAARGLLDQVRHLPLLSSTDGLARPDDPTVFLPPVEKLPLVSGSRQVEAALAGQPELAELLDANFGLKPLSVLGQIERVILPSLAADGESLPAAVLAEYLQFVQRYYFRGTPAEQQTTLAKRLRHLLRVPTALGNWVSPAEVCLAKDEYGQPTLAGRLLAGASPALFVATPADAETAAFYRWLGVQTEPPPAMLIKALSQPGWFADRPPDWFQDLYHYLDRQLTPTNLNSFRHLPIIPNPQPGKPPVAPADIFLPTTHLDAQLTETFAEADIKFAPLDFFPEPAAVQAFLERLWVTEFSALRAIEQIILNQFAEPDVVAEPLLHYTAFALETFQREQGLEALPVREAFQAAVKLKTTTGTWERPAELYLTSSYGGPDFETLLAGFQGAVFVSADYLDFLPEPGLWQDFFIELGVRCRLEVTLSRTRRHLPELLNQNERLAPYLHTIIETNIDGQDVPALQELRYHYLTNHATIDWLPEIIAAADPARLEILLTLLAEGWSESPGYEQVMTVSYEKYYHQSYPLQERPSFVAWLLRTQPVLPTTAGLLVPGEQPVYRDTPALRQLVGNAVPYLPFQPNESHAPFLADFLGVSWEPEQAPLEAVLAHLRRLKQTNTATTGGCAAIYRYLADQENSDWLAAESLIYLPTPTRDWWAPADLFWDDYADRFGELRGYLQLEPAYESLRPVFKALGVNTGPPRPLDWANLLAALPERGGNEVESIVETAYKELERFWRTTETEPDWWSDFLHRVALLTEAGDFRSPLDTGLYVADHPRWYRLLRDELPFIRLPDHATPGQYQHLFRRLGLRRLSDPEWLDVIVEPGEWREPVPSLRQEIINNFDYIYSILIHYYPDIDYAVDIQPRLARLADEAQAFQVHAVKYLDVYLQSQQPAFKYPLTERAFYDHHANKLYIVVSKSGRNPGLEEDVGLGLATLFGPFSEAVPAALMQLFRCGSERDKMRLLERLRLQFRRRPDDPTPVSSSSPIPTTRSTVSLIEAEQVTITVTGDEIVAPHNKKDQLAELPGLYETTPEQIGRWGEQFAYRWLKTKFQQDHPAGSLTETEIGFKIQQAGQVVVDVHWLNKKRESGNHFDMRVMEQGRESYWEVKATRSIRPEQPLLLSLPEWELVREYGSQYFILRVMGTGTAQAHVKVLQNPYALWREGKLYVEPLTIKLKL